MSKYTAEQLEELRKYSIEMQSARIVLRDKHDELIEDLHQALVAARELLKEYEDHVFGEHSSCIFCAEDFKHKPNCCHPETMQQIDAALARVKSE